MDNLAKVEVNTQENSLEKSLPMNAFSHIDKKIDEEIDESDSKMNESKLSISNLSPQKYIDKRAIMIDDIIINSRDKSHNNDSKSPRPV